MLKIVLVPFSTCYTCTSYEYATGLHLRVLSATYLIGFGLRAPFRSWFLVMVAVCTSVGCGMHGEGKSCRQDTALLLLLLLLRTPHGAMLLLLVLHGLLLRSALLLLLLVKDRTIRGRRTE